MSAQDKYEKIEGYLNKTLSEEDMKAFEREMQADSALAEEVRLFADIDKAIIDTPALNFQRMVKEQGELFLKEEKHEEATIRTMNIKPYQWAIAAAVVLLIVSTVLLLNRKTPEQLSGKELFAQNIEPYSLDGELRGQGNDSTEKAKAIKHYQNKEFDQAAGLFQQLADENPQDMESIFYLANAYLNQKEFDKAQKEFEKIIKDNESLLVEDSRWYLALIFLHQEQI
ncbi:MAG: tetratricopeptide repeat protein, partial [Bacteroidetes bacterium]|nr:tetratricopeptide repeat protein [Bacteroidota bacterium]